MTSPLTDPAILCETVAGWFEANPKGWTRNTGARDAHDQPVKPTDLTAVCFCTLGRIERVLSDAGVSADDRFKATGMIEKVNRFTLYSGSIIAFNDSCDDPVPVIRQLRDIAHHLRLQTA